LSDIITKIKSDLIVFEHFAQLGRIFQESVVQCTFVDWRLNYSLYGNCLWSCIPSYCQLNCWFIF